MVVPTKKTLMLARHNLRASCLSHVDSCTDVVKCFFMILIFLVNEGHVITHHYVSPSVRGRTGSHTPYDEESFHRESDADDTSDTSSDEDEKIGETSADQNNVESLFSVVVRGTRTTQGGGRDKKTPNQSVTTRNTSQNLLTK